jgi:superfamily II DNA/RNA helicase
MCAAIHGDKDQRQRDFVLANFRNGRTPVMVATDVAARGIDVKEVKVVVNYDFPGNDEREEKETLLGMLWACCGHAVCCVLCANTNVAFFPLVPIKLINLIILCCPLHVLFIPGNVEDYVHRIGRTGRAGAKGKAVTFFTQKDGGKTRKLIEVMEKAEQVRERKDRDVCSVCCAVCCV